MSSKKPFKFIRKWLGADGYLCVEYEASFWNGPLEAGNNGYYTRTKVRDKWLKRLRNGKVVGGSFLSTAPNVSFYKELCKSAGV